MSLFVKEVTCDNEFPDIVSVICVNGSGVIDERDYVPERTCKPEVEHHGDMILTRYPCCGYELKGYRYSPYPEVAFNNCPNCGAKVVR